MCAMLYLSKLMTNKKGYSSCFSSLRKQACSCLLFVGGRGFPFNEDKKVVVSAGSAKCTDSI